jgi:hypothetical protein
LRWSLIAAAVVTSPSGERIEASASRSSTCSMVTTAASASRSSATSAATTSPAATASTTRAGRGGADLVVANRGFGRYYLHVTGGSLCATERTRMSIVFPKSSKLHTDRIARPHRARSGALALLRSAPPGDGR